MLSRKLFRVLSRTIRLRPAVQRVLLGPTVRFCHKRGSHGCFPFVDHPFYPVLAGRTACSCSVSHRLGSYATFPSGWNCGSRRSRACQRSLHAPDPAPARSARHLNASLVSGPVNCEVKPRKTSVFIYLQALLGPFVLHV